MKDNFFYFEGKKVPYQKEVKLKAGFCDKEIYLSYCKDLSKYTGMSGAFLNGNIVLENDDIETLAHEVTHAVFWLIKEMGVEEINVKDDLSDEYVAHLIGFLSKKVYDTMRKWLNAK